MLFKAEKSVSLPTFYYLSFSIPLYAGECVLCGFFYLFRVLNIKGNGNQTQIIQNLGTIKVQKYFMLPAVDSNHSNNRVIL